VKQTPTPLIKEKWGINSGLRLTYEDQILLLSSGWMIGKMEGNVKGQDLRDETTDLFPLSP